MKDIAREIAKRGTIKGKTEEKETMQRRGVSRVFSRWRNGGRVVHDGDAVSGACNLKSSQGS